MHGKRGERKELVEEQQKFRRVCSDDIRLLCRDADLSNTGIMGCLNMHDKELSAQCADSIKAMKTRKE